MENIPPEKKKILRQTTKATNGLGDPPNSGPSAKLGGPVSRQVHNTSHRTWPSLGNHCSPRVVQGRQQQQPWEAGPPWLPEPLGGGLGVRTTTAGVPDERHKPPMNVHRSAGALEGEPLLLPLDNGVLVSSLVTEPASCAP